MDYSQKSLNYILHVYHDFLGNGTVFLFSSDPHQKEEVNKKAFEKFKKEHSVVPTTVDNAMPSERFDGKFVELLLISELLSVL